MASASRRYLVNLPTIHRPLTPPPPSSRTLFLATTGLSAYLSCLGSDPGNSLTGGIMMADRVVTVSPSYKEEICTEMGGWGLAEYVRPLPNLC